MSQRRKEKKEPKPVVKDKNTDAMLVCEMLTKAPTEKKRRFRAE